MPIVYVLPGLCGSKLYFDRGFIDLAWPAPLLLPFGQIKYLALAANGIDPEPDHGEFLYTKAPERLPGVGTISDDGLVSYFYEKLIEQLEKKLTKKGYSVVPWPYDWRKQIRSTGLLLANQIRRDYPVNGPCTLFAHSMGGLVARVAWWSLAETTQSYMVRRIITLGTPHQGSYTMVNAFFGDSPVVKGMLLLNDSTAGLPGLRGGLARNQLSVGQILDVAITWPGIYDLMPTLGGSEAARDPNRVRIFNNANYPSFVRFDQPLMARSRTAWSPFLLLPNTYPPYSVLTTVAGHGFASHDGLADPRNPITLEKLGFSQDTDTTVTGGSAIIPRSRVYHFTARHMSLPGIVARCPWLEEMVLEERSDIDPTAPTVTDPTPHMENPPWPPLQVRQSNPPVQPCRMGQCSC